MTNAKIAVSPGIYRMPTNQKGNDLYMDLQCVKGKVVLQRMEVVNGEGQLSSGVVGSGVSETAGIQVLKFDIHQNETRLKAENDQRRADGKPPIAQSGKAQLAIQWEPTGVDTALLSVSYGNRLLKRDWQANDNAGWSRVGANEILAYAEETVKRMGLARDQLERLPKDSELDQKLTKARAIIEMAPGFAKKAACHAALQSLAALQATGTDLPISGHKLQDFLAWQTRYSATYGC